MDYSQLSDFEINAEVFEALHGGTPDYKDGDNGEMLLVSFEADVVGGDIVEVEVVRGSFNPCNNPADAWPIIKENNITLILQDGISPCAISGVNTGICFEIEFEHMSQGENPLRQAMIVFLMMQDAKHD